MPQNFKRKIEDFVCENCGQKVVGNGYTNHCPKCLWSKHVDIIPGDRAADCGGLMKPVSFAEKSGEYDLSHRCLKCGREKINKMSPDDNFDEMLKISAERL